MHSSDASFTERPVCEVCGSTRWRSVLRRAFLDPSVWQFLAQYYDGRVPQAAVEGRDYELVRCGECGFLWQRWVLDPAGMALLYSEWIRADASLAKRRLADAGLFAGYAREMMVIARFFPGSKPADIRVLDYGMGWGYWCLMAKAFGYQEHGLEVSPERIAYARERGVRTIGPADLPAHRFEFINSEQCFEHITEPLRALRSLAASLVPGGIARLSVPDASRAVRTLSDPRWQARKDPFHPLEHVSCYTHASLTRLAREAGLAPVVRPALFPIVAWDAPSLLRTLGSRLYYRWFGTSLYFRKAAG